MPPNSLFAGVESAGADAADCSKTGEEKAAGIASHIETAANISAGASLRPRGWWGCRICVSLPRGRAGLAQHPGHHPGCCIRAGVPDTWRKIFQSAAIMAWGREGNNRSLGREPQE